MRSYRRSFLLVTSLALMPLAGVASAGQARPRSAPPAQGSSSTSSGTSGSSSSSSSSPEQNRPRTQAQPRERESAPPPQQQSQRQEQTREREQPQQSQRQEQRDREQVQQRERETQAQRPQQQNGQYDARQNNDRNDNSRAAIPAPRDRYIDTNGDGRNDNRDSRVLGPQDRRDIERRNDNSYNTSRYDGRYDRYDNRYSSYSPYRYDGPRVVLAPRQSVRFSRPWFSFRPLIRLPFGLTLGVAQAFPSWYRPYIVGRPGYVSPYMPYGGVTFDIEPRDAELWIDGEYIGRASDYSYNDPPLTLVAGSHYVELRSRYGRPLAFDITVIPGQVIPYQGTLPYYR